MSRFLSCVDAINEWVGKSITYLVPLMAGLLLYEVISRYFFERTHYWIIETSAFIFVTYVMLAGAYVMLHKRHIVMDLFYSRYSPKVRLAVDMVTCLCLFIFAGLLLWKSAEMAFSSWQAGETTISLFAPPLYPVKTVMAIGFLFILLQGLAGFIRTVTALLRRVS